MDLKKAMEKVEKRAFEENRRITKKRTRREKNLQKNKMIQMRGLKERYTTLEKTKQIQIQGLENRKTIKKKD